MHVAIPPKTTLSTLCFKDQHDDIKVDGNYCNIADNAGVTVLIELLLSCFVLFVLFLCLCCFILGCKKCFPKKLNVFEIIKFFSALSTMLCLSVAYLQVK